MVDDGEGAVLGGVGRQLVQGHGDRQRDVRRQQHLGPRDPDARHMLACIEAELGNASTQTVANGFTNSGTIAGEGIVDVGPVAVAGSRRKADLRKSNLGFAKSSEAVTYEKMKERVSAISGSRSTSVSSSFDAPIAIEIWSGPDDTTKVVDLKMTFSDLKLSAIELADQRINGDIFLVPTRGTEPARLGIVLLERGPNGAQPTPEGRVYYEQVHPALAVLEAAVPARRHDRSLRSLRVAAISSLNMRWLVPRMASLHAAHPDLDIIFKPYWKDDDFRREDVDCWIQTRLTSTSRWPSHVQATYIIGRISTLSFTATGRLTMLCIPRMPLCGGLMIGVESIEPYTPPLEMVKVPPVSSS